MNEFSTPMVERLWINAIRPHGTASPSKGNSSLPKLKAGRGTKDELKISRSPDAASAPFR
jgi:hypothetical protein